MKNPREKKEQTGDRGLDEIRTSDGASVGGWIKEKKAEKEDKLCL